MKNKLLNKFREKINDTLDHLDSIEDDILKLAKRISEMIQQDEGRIIFVGAGISASMAHIIIEELWFNFQIKSDKFISLTAAKAYSNSVDKWKEFEEISQTSVFELEEINLQPNDLLIGLSSSGKTKYVVAALNYAMECGCETALITDMDNSELIEKISFSINTKFGSPIVMGLNAAEGSTVQKIVLDNVIYLAMELAGRIYKDNLVYMRPVSKKIEKYCINVVMDLVKVDYDEAALLFENCERNLELTLVSTLKGVSIDEARDILFENKGNFNKIL